MSFTRRNALAAAAGLAAFAASFGARAAGAAKVFEVAYSDAEWRSRLSGPQYAVLRQAGTERPYTSALNDEHRRGRFSCAGCRKDLFASDAKFESGTGWPSFFAPLEGAVGVDRDTAYGMVRDEVHCARCGGHLGHVFDDGPKPTGLRYCMNGVAMTFKPTSA